SADSSRLHMAHPATWASSADLREAMMHPRTNAAMSSSVGQASSSDTCAIALSPSTAVKRAQADLDATPDHPQDAIDVLRRHLELRHQAVASRCEHHLSRAAQQARDRGAMHAIQHRELVEGRAVEVVLAQQRLLTVWQRPQRGVEGALELVP